MRRMTGRGLPALVLVLVVVAMAPVAAFGAGGGGQDYAPQPAIPGEASRLAPDLAALEDAFAAGGRPAAADLAARTSLFVRGGIVEVEVLTDGDDGAAAAAVRSAGGIVVVALPGFVGAEMPLGSLARLAGGRGVRWVQSPAPVYPEAVANEAVPVMDVDDWHAAGFHGEGVDVAVVDSGFYGYPAAQANGDLPANLRTKDYCEDGMQVDEQHGGTKHGTGVAEIVYDIAPAADLWLICIDNSTDLAKAITWMGQSGIDVFNASLGFIAAYPGDGTGTLRTYSTKAEKAGVTWINSAGNYGLNHWGGTFTDGDADGVHEFAPGDEGFTVTVPGNWYIQVKMRWDDTWPGAANDFDLYFYDQATAAELAKSTTCQGMGTVGCGGSPKEETFYNNGATQRTVEIVLRRGAGPSAAFPYIEFFFLPTSQPGLTPVDAVVPAGSLNDASTVAKVLAVGAAAWNPAWTGGVFAVEDFSSRGPTRDGRTKPDVAGYDRVAGFSYPGGFGGTSAAAPHAAGMAALLLQANPDFSPAQLRAAIKSHTVNLPPAGMDNDSGKGRLRLGAPPALPTCNGKTVTILGSGDGEIIDGTASADVIMAFGGDDTINGLGGNDTICAGGGDDTVLGGVGADVIYGGAGNDSLTGEGGNDQLYGEAGDDILSGGPGSDVVDGGPGTDTCSGGETTSNCAP